MIQMRRNKKRYAVGIVLLSMVLFIGGSVAKQRVHAEPDGEYETTTITPEPTESIAAITPGPMQAASPKPTSICSPKPTATTKSNKEKSGWHKTKTKKKYYIDKNGKPLKGYQKIDGNFYYFSKKTSYALTNTWKYVKIKGHKYKVYFGKSGKQVKDVSKILGKKARYRVYVSLKDNMVMIYAQDGGKGYTIPVKAMVCSVGMRGHATRKGTYSLRPSGRWHVLRYNSTGQYATRYSGPYMFHSVTYDRFGNHYSLQKKEYKKLGKASSHGCIRLQVEDAKWIYEHAYQSVAIIRQKVGKGPFTKPKAKKMGKSARGYYDPTDSVVE